MFLSDSFEVQIIWLSQKIQFFFFIKKMYQDVLDLHMNLCPHLTIP